MDIQIRWSWRRGWNPRPSDYKSHSTLCVYVTACGLNSLRKVHMSHYPTSGAPLVTYSCYRKAKQFSQKDQNRNNLAVADSI